MKLFKTPREAMEYASKRKGRIGIWNGKVPAVVCKSECDRLCKSQGVRLILWLAGRFVASHHCVLGEKNLITNHEAAVKAEAARRDALPLKDYCELCGMEDKHNPVQPFGRGDGAFKHYTLCCDCRIPLQCATHLERILFLRILGNFPTPDFVD